MVLIAANSSLQCRTVLRIVVFPHARLYTVSIKYEAINSEKLDAKGRNFLFVRRLIVKVPFLPSLPLLLFLLFFWSLFYSHLSFISTSCLRWRVDILRLAGSSVRQLLSIKCYVSLKIPNRITQVASRGELQLSMDERVILWRYF